MLSSRDSWSLQLIGKTLHYKEQEFEDDDQFRIRNASNAFIIHSIVAHSAERSKFLSANVRYARRNLHFVFYSVDDINEYVVTPVASFYPNSPERDKLFTLQRLDGPMRAVAPTMVANEQYGDYMQGVHDESSKLYLTPKQMGVLLTFAPPSEGYIAHVGALSKLRKSFAVVLKKLNALFPGFFCSADKGVLGAPLR